MKTFLCIEEGEKFFIREKTWEEARKTAAIYNAQVVFMYARNGERIYNEQNKTVKETL